MPNNSNSKHPIPMKVAQIKCINDLKSFGSFVDAKHLISNEIGVPVKSRGWESLFHLIELLSKSIKKHREELIYFATDENALKSLGCFNEAKKNISKLISYKIKARGWADLKIKLEKLITPFTQENIELDRYSFFEANKHSNFISSSMLEGINIENEISLSMEEVIKKYKVEQVNG